MLLPNLGQGLVRQDRGLGLSALDGPRGAGIELGHMVSDLLDHTCVLKLQ